MPNIYVTKKILKEKGFFEFIKLSINSVYERLSFKNKFLFYTILKIIRIPVKKSKKVGRVSVILCIDAEGPKMHSVNNNWNKILSDINKLFNQFPHMKINFFVTAWIGFKDKSILEQGHHKIFDRYSKFKNIFWHYHHPSYKGIDDWDGRKYYEDIINRKIIDRKYFPSVFRAGHTFEGKKAKKWLNKWIPFDLSNRAPYIFWEKYPSSWEPIKENRRHIFRSLDAENTNWSTLSETDKAFKQASEGKNIVISFFTHDYKKFIEHISYVDLLLNCSSKKYPAVKFQYVNALSAFRKFLIKNQCKSLYLTIIRKSKHKLIIKSNRPIYQKYPYIVLKKRRTYLHEEDVKKIDKTVWELALKDGFDKVGIAASDKFGYSRVKVIDL